MTFFEFWDFFKDWHVDLRVECILRTTFDLLYSEVHVLAYSIFAIMQSRVSASSHILRCMHAFGKCGPCSPGGGGGGDGPANPRLLYGHLLIMKMKLKYIRENFFSNK